MIYKVFVLFPTIVVSDGIVGIAWLGKVFGWRYGKNKKKSKKVAKGKKATIKLRRKLIPTKTIKCSRLSAIYDPMTFLKKFRRATFQV